MPTALDDHICFTLYATSMAITRMYKPMLDSMGITYPQYLMLKVLEGEDGATIGAIAGRLDLESSTVTPAVKRLETAGMVARARSRTDERQVRVTLTGQGRDVLARSDCLGDALVARAGMTRDEMDALNRRLQALRAGLAGEDGP